MQTLTESIQDPFKLEDNVANGIGSSGAPQSKNEKLAISQIASGLIKDCIRHSGGNKVSYPCSVNKVEATFCHL
jgi:hypothetical protein